MKCEEGWFRPKPPTTPMLTLGAINAIVDSPCTPCATVEEQIYCPGGQFSAVAPNDGIFYDRTGGPGVWSYVGAGCPLVDIKNVMVSGGVCASAPTAVLTTAPTAGPTAAPTAGPTAGPTADPTAGPTAAPTAGPTAGPTAAPTAGPTVGPKTCEELGWLAGQGTAEVCAESNLPYMTCVENRFKTFAAAEETCVGIGARLCTEHELVANEAFNTGLPVQRCSRMVLDRMRRD
jgi:hypothetical protein